MHNGGIVFLTGDTSGLPIDRTYDCGLQGPCGASPSRAQLRTIPGGGRGWWGCRWDDTGWYRASGALDDDNAHAGLIRDG